MTMIRFLICLMSMVYTGQITASYMHKKSSSARESAAKQQAKIDTNTKLLDASPAENKQLDVHLKSLVNKAKAQKKNGKATKRATGQAAGKSEEDMCKDLFG